MVDGAPKGGFQDIIHLEGTLDLLIQALQQAVARRLLHRLLQGQSAHAAEPPPQKEAGLDIVVAVHCALLAGVVLVYVSGRVERENRRVGSC